ncbi:MAG: MFS transporter [Lysinibacillus sp.]
MRPFGMRDKLGYLFGDFGNDFFFLLVSSFLMVYYTDVYGLSAAWVGGLFLIARLWDAVADVTWGRFIDTRKPGKNGKFRPWVFRMSFPLVFTGVLMFVHIPGMSTGFYEAYAFVTYIVWGTLYSTVNIPYGSMASVMTDDPVERASLSTYRTIGATLAGLVINAVGPLIVFVDNKADADGFFMAAILFGILSISCYMACYKLTTERIVAPAGSTEKVDLKTTVKGLVKNKPLIAILAASLIFMMNMMLVGAVNVYLFKDYFSSAATLSFVSIAQTVAVLLVAPFVKTLTTKFGKKEMSIVGMMVASAAYFVLFFLKDISAMTFVFISFIGFIGFGLFNTVIWAFVTDVIDYQEYLTDQREDGTVYSVYSFARKVGQALAGGIGGFAIAAVGYDAALEVQTDAALNGIHTLATLVPAIVYLLILLILIFFYPLNKTRLAKMQEELAAKRALKE